MTGVTFQESQIIDSLSDHGWDLDERSDGEDWRVDEVWILRSRWAPTAATVLLTFLIDPQNEGVRRKDENIWAVACSRKPLEDWTDRSSGSLIQISPGWQREKPKFWRLLADLRGD